MSCLAAALVLCRCSRCNGLVMLELYSHSSNTMLNRSCSQGADKDRLVSFSRHFDAAVRGLQRLIRIDAWLSRTGRHLQVGLGQGPRS